jgi:hypothetical protein
MIAQEQLSEYIAKSIPHLREAVSGQSMNTYDVVKELLGHTTRSLDEGDVNEAKKCMLVAEQLYHQGCPVVKNAVENVFVFSFSHSFFCDSQNKEQLLKIVPPGLYDLYKKQMLNSHL